MKNNILKNMLILATGSAASKLLAFAAIPFITRLYSPEDFGTLSIFISIIAILGPFCTLKYTTAIPLPKKDQTAIQLTFMILIISLITSSLFFFIFFIFKEDLFLLFSIKKVIDYWYLIPLSLFLFSLYEIFNFWFTRKMEFKFLSKNLFFQTTLGTLVKLILGYLSFGPIGLIIGQIISQSFGIVNLIYKFSITSKIRINFKYILFLQKYYLDFPKYKLPSHFLYTLSFQAPLLFTSILYGIETTGQLGLAFSVLALPITLIGQTTSQAYYSEISKIGNKRYKEIYSITKDITKKMFLISFFPFLVLVFFGPDLFKIFFGNSWINAGIYTQILSIYLLFQFITSPIMQVYNVINKQKNVLIIHFRRLLLVLLTFLIAYTFKLSVIPLLAMYSIILSIHYILIYLNVIKILKGKK